MSLSPINILQRLQDLKSWQQNHEELLKRNKSSSDLNLSCNSSDYRTIDGLSAFDSTIIKENVNWESKTISPTKSFDQLLEEKLAEDPGPTNISEKPKKPFLKKGSGLERFRLKPNLKIPTNKKVKMKKTQSSVTPLRAPDLSIKPKATWSKVNETENHINKINELVQSKTPELSDQTLYEKALEKELLIFEALEEKAENSSFCSTNSSVLRILSSTPSKIRKELSITEEKRVHWEETDEEIESNLERKDIEEILFRLQNLAENRIVSDDERSSTETETSISSTDLEITLKSEKRDIGIGTENSEDMCNCGNKLEKKIQEYERKIFEIVQDKNKIEVIRNQLELLEKDFVKKQKEFEEEKKIVLLELENEKKKLIKEKQIYQSYIKDSQNRPNKKEREEISNLKQEVADLRETLKLKESKNGMTQARLRNQIKQLEKENSNLKEDIDKLTKENAKLTATKKSNRRPSDTKILQEISKNITKLASKDQILEKSNREEPPKEHSTEKDDSLIDLGNYFDVERQYVSAFKDETRPNVSLSLDKSERLLENGTKQIRYSNGNVKTISPDGNLITTKYFNGDIKETNLIDGTIKYFFFDKNIWQTTYPDGMEFVEFPDGIKEKRFKDGKVEVTLPDNVIHTSFPDSTQEIQYPDGSILNITSDGDKILHLPNGQKEIETKDHKRREYPDGTVKILHMDGTQETRYSNGRVRIKDRNGKLVLDTQN